MTTLTDTLASQLADATKRLADTKREVARLEREALNAFRTMGRPISELYTHVAKEGVISELSTLAQARAGVFDISNPTTQELSEKPEDLASARSEWGF